MSGKGLGPMISIGGALGILHYLDFRPTQDVDAWWMPSATEEDRKAVVSTIEGTLRAFGRVRTRAWGDVVSVELVQENKVVFSFQIARRSAQLQRPVRVPWTEVFLDDIQDLVASKMVALIERGAPRDFRDIYALCHSGIVSPRECWDLWGRRQELAKSDSDTGRAKLAIQTHLQRIALLRPLEQIDDADRRTQTVRLRSWFQEDFLNVLK